MSLIVTARNLSNLSDVSDYEVFVRINGRVIWSGVIKGHVRSEGWRELLRLISETSDHA